MPFRWDLPAFAEKRSRQGKLIEASAFQKLIRLILVSLLAAFITICLYGIIWLAIGSNLLIKEDPAFQGTGHVQMILRHPFICVSTGIDYMLATPYIQSVPKEGFLTKLVTWLQNLFIQYLDGSWWLIPMIPCAGNPDSDRKQKKETAVRRGHERPGKGRIYRADQREDGRNTATSYGDLYTCNSLVFARAA